MAFKRNCDLQEYSWVNIFIICNYSIKANHYWIYGFSLMLLIYCSSLRKALERTKRMFVWNIFFSYIYEIGHSENLHCDPNIRLCKKKKKKRIQLCCVNMYSNAGLFSRIFPARCRSDTSFPILSHSLCSHKAAKEMHGDSVSL